MQMSRYITQRATAIAFAIVLGITLYGMTVDDPPRHTTQSTTQQEGAR